MANVYVHSGAAGAGTGADWANAYTTLAAAFAAKAAGDTFWLANDHAETQGSAMALTSPGTSVSPCFVYCVNRAGSVPPVSADLRTTATITTTGSFTITYAGVVAICYGVTITVGGTSGAANHLFTGGAFDWHFVSSAILLTNNFSNALIQVGVTGNLVERLILENTTVQFGNTGQSISLRNGVFIWKNTVSAISGATLPNTLITSGFANKFSCFVQGVDLSALGSGKTIVGAITSSSLVQVMDCKLGASVTKAATPTVPAANAIFLRTDSADTNYLVENFAYEGTQTTETTIVRSGGATDGTTAVAWKIVTTANSRWESSFECLPISIWNETIGSAITVTIQGIWGGGAVPLNDEVWIDVEYLGTSGFPLASKATSTKANGLAAGSAIPAGSGTWGGSTTKFAMAATFTPQEKGPLTIYVKSAKVSSTFYIDPKPVVT
jgi:hypothetical protein